MRVNTVMIYSFAMDCRCRLGGEVPEQMHVLTLHPYELARQMTLIEAALFRYHIMCRFESWGITYLD